jgi:Ca2+-transporting ATPase
LTARAIGTRLGLVSDERAIVTGAELAAWSPADLAERVGDVRVFARVAPEQKLAIVAALQERGEIVAVTGDGVNDAPALRQADIGVAMGIMGTDVAKEASGMVLLDDNFATIVAAVREGRRVYDNLRRFIRYVLTTNAGEIWTIFLAPFLGLPIPLLPIQILWINLVTDGLPGLALAAEPAERDVMRRPPRPPGESVFAHGLGAHALFVGLAMAGIALGTEAWAWNTDVAQWQTLVFTTLCFMQLGHVLAIRSERTSLLTQGLLSNAPLAGAVALTVALQLAVVYVPALNGVFTTVPLTASQLAGAVGAGIAILAVVEVEKWWRRAR